MNNNDNLKMKLNKIYLTNLKYQILLQHNTTTTTGH